MKPPPLSTPHRGSLLRVPALFSLLLPALLPLAACDSARHLPLAPERASATLNGNAPFPVWHQGFEHDTDGWYGAATPGLLGWCGTIERETRVAGDHSPSAGRAYATVAGGPCNELWSSLGVPYGAPYGPGPDQSLYSSVWPEAGYVAELDVFLDPAWSSSYTGTFASDVLVEYGTTIFELNPDPGTFHTGPHYFVGVEADGDALSVLGHPIEDAGWYVFRFVYGDEGGHIEVGFELRDRDGALLTRRDAIEPVELLGPVKVPFTGELLTSEWGSGHVWFFDIASGLQLPIDEYRVRQGR